MYILILFFLIITILFISWNLYRTFYTTETTLSLDENGIAFRDYGIKNGKMIGKHYNPVFAGSFSLKFYKDFKQSGNETAKQYLINNAEWVLENVKEKENYSIYIYDFPWDDYNLPKDEWVDALAQTRMMLILIRAHELTNDERYLYAAESLLKALYVEVKDGGVTYKDENGWWYEHFAHPDGDHPRVLNAHLIVLSELDEFIKYTDSESAKFLFHKGLEAAINDLHYYDLNGYTWLNRVGDPSTFGYHKIHIEQTKNLYDITGEKKFLEYYEKWNSCEYLCQNWNFYYNYVLKKIGLN